MSIPKRYIAKISWAQIETQEHPNGEFVIWSDYALIDSKKEKLEEEVLRLKEINLTLSRQCEFWEGMSRKITEWFSMDSAPLDGSKILAFCRTRIFIASWDGFKWIDSSSMDEIEPTMWTTMVKKPNQV